MASFPRLFRSRLPPDPVAANVTPAEQVAPQSRLQCYAWHCGQVASGRFTFCEGYTAGFLLSSKTRLICPGTKLAHIILPMTSTKMTQL